MLERTSEVPGKVIQMTKMEQQPPEQPVESEAEKAVRIKQLRKEIKAGTYRVPALELADRMLERLDWQ